LADQGKGMISEEENKELISYIEQNIGNFENINSTVTNYIAYAILYKHAEEKHRRYYESQAQKWNTLMTEEKKSNFRIKLSHGNYFLAFNSILYDLQSSLKQQEYAGLVCNDQQANPNPFVVSGGKILLSEQFIDRGRKLFLEDSFLNDSQLDDERKYYNETATNNMNQLFKVLIDLNTSPRLREIVDRYNKAFREFTIPDN
jgi:hypothetical protein